MTFAALTPEDVARLHADTRPGYELVSYGEIGLPFFELKIQAQILEHKRIDPFAEFILRAAANGLTDAAEMEQLLGLDTRVLEATLVALIGKDLLSLDADTGEVSITVTGDAVLADAVQIEPGICTASRGLRPDTSRCNRALRRLSPTTRSPGPGHQGD